MRARSSIAAVLVLTLTMMHAPAVAHAEEAEPAPPQWAVQAPAPIDLNVHALGRAWPGYSGELHSAFGPAPAPIRLSSGAKTAIIVGAIVGGVLLITGLIVLAKPHKL